MDLVFFGKRLNIPPCTACQFMGNQDQDWASISLSTQNKLKIATTAMDLTMYRVDRSRWQPVRRFLAYSWGRQIAKLPPFAFHLHKRFWCQSIWHLRRFFVQEMLRRSVGCPYNWAKQDFYLRVNSKMVDFLKSLGRRLSYSFWPQRLLYIFICFLTSRA